MTPHTPPDIAKLTQLIDETITQDRGDPACILSYLHECRQLEIDVLPMDINRSGYTCTIEDERNIRMGFSLIAPEEDLFIENLLSERQEHGAFQSFQDFCERVDLENVPVEFIARTIQVGVFDSVEPSRARLFQGHETIIHAVRLAKAEKDSGQISLFAAISSPSDEQMTRIELPDADEWTEDEIIDREKDAIGFSFTELLFREEEAEESPIEIPEDSEPSQIAESPNVVEAEDVTNKIKHGIPPEEPSGTPKEIPPDSVPARVIIQLSASATTDSILRQLQEVIKKHSGPSPLMLEFLDNDQNRTWIQAHPDYSVLYSDDFIKDVETLLGENTTRVQK